MFSAHLASAFSSFRKCLALFPLSSGGDSGCGEGDREGKGGLGVLVKFELKQDREEPLGTEVKAALFLSVKPVLGAIPSMENIRSLREVSTKSSSSFSFSIFRTLVRGTRFFTGELG